MLITKIYTQEKLYDIMSWACSYMENDVMVKGHPMEEKIRDAIQLQTYDDPKDSLKLYVGIAGIQYCGVCEHNTFPIFPFPFISFDFDSLIAATNV